MADADILTPRSDPRLRKRPSTNTPASSASPGRLTPTSGDLLSADDMQRYAQGRPRSRSTSLRVLFMHGLESSAHGPKFQVRVRSGASICLSLPLCDETATVCYCWLMLMTDRSLSWFSLCMGAGMADFRRRLPTIFGRNCRNGGVSELTSKYMHECLFLGAMGGIMALLGVFRSWSVPKLSFFRVLVRATLHTHVLPCSAFARVVSSHGMPF